MGRLNTLQGFAGATSIIGQTLEPEYLGAVMIFAQSSAPAGWVKQTTYNDYALRVVSGDGGGSSVTTQPFSTVFAQTSTIFAPESGLSISMGATSTTTISTTQMQSHTHTGYGPAAAGISGYTTGWPGSGPGSPFTGIVNPVGVVTGAVSTATGAGGGHAHASGTITAIAYSSSFNFGVYYKDVILAKYN